MTAKGVLGKGQKVDWNIVVDPKIKAGVVYSIGDLLVDASYRSLQAQFFQNLEAAGIKRVG